ncbi:MAG: PIN domain-containing protein [Candidatus Riflebacteria bacterium]|nr:PIN domain-containing protein [Candidatus Riflebacteria bacterium]
MKSLRIYVDTSVLGGCFDPEFERWSVGLIEDFRTSRFRPVLSELTAAEALRAPDCVRDLYAEVLDQGAEMLSVDSEALALREIYRSRGVLGIRFSADMLHIAVATIADVDVLVSWNFRHIVRLDKIRLFNGINLEQGYKGLTICSPREVTVLGRDEGDQGS